MVLLGGMLFTGQQSKGTSVFCYGKNPADEDWVCCRRHEMFKPSENSLNERKLEGEVSLIKLFRVYRIVEGETLGMRIFMGFQLVHL